MFSFLKRRSESPEPINVSTIFALVYVSAFAYIIYLLKIVPKQQVQKVESVLVPPDPTIGKVGINKRQVFDYFVSALIFALLIFAYFQLRQMIINFQNYPGNKYTIPESINEAALWTFDTKKTLTSNTVAIDRHLNNSHGLLIATDKFLTPIYGWGIALAYPDLCKYNKGDPFQVNVVYVVNGTIKEFIKIPIVGSAKVYNLSKSLGNVKVNVNVQLENNCKFSTVSAELTKK